MTKIPACLAAVRTSSTRSKVCRSCTRGFCAMFPAEKSAMSSAVVLLSSVISSIPHLPLALTPPLGDVRRTTYTVTALNTTPFNMGRATATPRLYAVVPKNSRKGPQTKTMVNRRRSGRSSSNSDVERGGPKHVCRRYLTLNVTGAPPRVGSLHRTPPVLRIIPEHQRGLHAGEENAVCHGFIPS